jgi:hypothetical protein
VKQGMTIERHGRTYVLFAGLLDEAHQRGLRSIDTDLIQTPSDTNGNVAIVKAVVEMEDGGKFTGIGDASPENVGRSIVPHIIRMAETRAKARALRDAINVGTTALEELGGEDEAKPPPTNGRLDPEAQARFRAKLSELGVEPDTFEEEYGPIAGLTMGAARNYIKSIQGEG